MSRSTALSGMKHLLSLEPIDKALHKKLTQLFSFFIVVFAPNNVISLR